MAACDGVDVVLVDARRVQRCVRSLCEEERAREPRHVAALVVHIAVALAGWRTWRPAPGGAVHPMVRRAEVISLCCLAKLELIRFFLCVGILFLFSVAGGVPARSGCAVCAPWCSPCRRALTQRRPRPRRASWCTAPCSARRAPTQRRPRPRRASWCTAPWSGSSCHRGCDGSPPQRSIRTALLEVSSGGFRFCVPSRRSSQWSM